jgi:hypothetical protein
MSGIDDDALFEMANIYPVDSGLPMTVWVSPRRCARRDVRIQVNLAHDNSMSIDNTAVVAVRPAPRLIAGHLRAGDLCAVTNWIPRNEAAIVAHWEGRISAIQFAQQMQRLL